MPIHILYYTYLNTPALTPLEIQELLKPAFDQARDLQLQLESKQNLERIPFVTVS